jgi:hypothetical protein
MCGSDTLAIDVSSTSMNVASVTVSAITHGLCFGFHICWAAAWPPDFDAGLSTVVAIQSK